VAGVLFLAALATLALIAASLLRGPASPKLVVVPELVGVSDKDVSAHVPPKSGWQVRYTDTRKDGTQAGQILAQDPARGEMLLQGGVLHLTRSLGDELRNVDASAFVGASQADAVAKLQSMGLKPEAVLAQKFDEQIAEGHVLQVLEAGKQVPKGGTVTLVISKGAEPRTLPDLAKQTPEQVKAALAQLGLQSAERQDYSETVETGKVIGTEPAGGQQAPKGSTVTAVISIGRRPIAVTNVIGMQAVDAANALEAQGLKVSTLGAPNRAVIATDPGPGETRYRGDPVVIITRQS
jgi:serine/threonine-protein kinase